MSKLLELSERCEAASGPDRMLDAEIDWTSHGQDGRQYVTESSYSNRAADTVSGWWRGPDDMAHRSPSFTASLDAAMTLVPKGLYPSVGQHGPQRWAANVTRQNERTWESWAATPALALCAAALRARHAMEAER